MPIRNPGLGGTKQQREEEKTTDMDNNRPRLLVLACSDFLSFDFDDGRQATEFCAPRDDTTHFDRGCPSALAGVGRINQLERRVG